MLDIRAEVKRLKIDLTYQDVSPWKILEIENDIISTVDGQTSDIIAKYFSSVVQYLNDIGANDYVASLFVNETPTKYTIAFESGKTDVFVKKEQQQKQDNTITKQRSIFDAINQINLANKKASRHYKGAQTEAIIQETKQDNSISNPDREGERIDVSYYLQTINTDMEKEIDSMISETISAIQKEIL